MDRSSFEALVARLNELARHSPDRYRRRVVFLGLLGYAYILFVVIGIVAALAGIGYLAVVANTSIGLQLLVKLGLPLALVAWAVIRGLNVRFPVPDGMPINRQDAPRLFAMLDELAAALDAPRSDVVLVTSDFNAGVVEVPRLGVLGWPRHYLVLGISMLAGLSTAQVRAVLAHELGHQSRRHGRITAWIYRIRTAWIQILASLRARGRGNILFAKFFEWYSPYFAAYSFVLARQQEYEADRHAAELTSPRDLGEALINLGTKQRYLGSILWPRVGRLLAEHTRPPEAVHHGLARDIAAALPEAYAGRYLTGALTEDTGVLDTHPALRDRLAAIGYSVPADPTQVDDAPPVANGLVELLGTEVADRLLNRFDTLWADSVAEKWKKGHADSIAERRRLSELGLLVEAGTATPADARQHALLVEEVDGWEAATPYYARYLEQNPNDLDMRLSYGRALLWQQNAAGIAQLEAASAKAQLAVAAHRLIETFFRDHGDAERARKHAAAANEYADMLGRANDERSGVSHGDVLEVHGMTDDQLEGIRHVLARERAIKRAYVLRKNVQYLPDLSYHVVVIDASSLFTTGSTRRALAKRLGATLPLPGRGHIMVCDSRRHWLIRRAKKTDGSLAYTRAR